MLTIFFFSALMVLIGRQEQRPACKSTATEIPKFAFGNRRNPQQLW